MSCPPIKRHQILKNVFRLKLTRKKGKAPSSTAMKTRDGCLLPLKSYGPSKWILYIIVENFNLQLPEVERMERKKVHFLGRGREGPVSVFQSGATLPLQYSLILNTVPAGGPFNPTPIKNRFYHTPFTSYGPLNRRHFNVIIIAIWHPHIRKGRGKRVPRTKRTVPLYKSVNS